VPTEWNHKKEVINDFIYQESLMMSILIDLTTCRKRRQPRKNATKSAPAEPSTPQRPTREEILRDSPGRITRR
jgi:hypothetical protein